MKKNDLSLIEETVPLKKQRRGGAANLILTALLVEAGRMLDEGMGRREVEAAAVKTFGMDKGFLSVLESVGREKAVSLMEYLSDSTMEDDPFIRTYDNFFSPPESLRLSGAEKKVDAEPLRDVPAEDTDEDFMLLDLLGRRFKGVLFMIAVDLVESGVVGTEDVETICKRDFGWDEGPFVMMNRTGVEESLRIVTEKMELSHRREINFPIPRMLIDQVGLKQPWMIPS